jgi:prepilin-type processing-associated H-X9-DG protein
MNPTFPVGITSSNDFSMKARLLPYLEQTNVWNSLNQCFDFNHASQPTAGATTIQTFLCPSDSNKVARVGGSYNGLDFGDTNYFNNLGTLLSLNGGLFDGPAYILGCPNNNSPTSYGSAVSLAIITDGTSNTAIFSEMLMGNSSTQAGRGSIWIASVAVTNTTPASPNLGTLAANLQSISKTYCQSSTSLDGTNTQGFSWLSSGNSEGGGYSHVNTPNTLSCFGNNQSAADNASAGIIYLYGNMLTASSNHPGGVNMGFLDGSVRFIKNTINPGTYGAISTMGGGEIISADSL